jgi:hypothetical protein
MYDYEPEKWIAMINNTINKHAKHLESVEFWVETQELRDRHDNAYTQQFPRLAVNFK